MRQRAQVIGLRGYVTNLPDGSVYFEAEGEKKKLQFLLELAAFGPIAADVKSTEPYWSEITDYSFEGDFAIRE